MSIVIVVMIAGWTTTLAMIGFFALKESGKLLKIRERVALWLAGLAAVVRPGEEDLDPESESAA